jgi:hypothetical protein
MIMPRPKGKATQIAYSILGKPQTQKLTKRQQYIQKKITAYEIRKVK